MSEMLILSGLPASGKSTYARKFIQENPTYTRINWDDMRRTFPGYKYPRDEKEIQRLSRVVVRSAASNGENVLIDNTNLSDKTIGQWTRLAGELNMTVRMKHFDIPLPECIFRDKARAGTPAYVGRYVIERMALDNNLIDFGRGKMVIVDIDGTLADSSHRRLPKKQTCPQCLGNGLMPIAELGDTDAACGTCAGHGYIDGIGIDWKHYFKPELVELDKPISTVVEWTRALYRAYNVVIVSGRPMNVAGEPTLYWLAKHNVPFDHIFMRKGGDMRDDTIVKQEILDKLPKDKIMFTIDDRNRVVDMWRKNGLTCYQVCSREEGEF